MATARTASRGATDRTRALVRVLQPRSCRGDSRQTIHASGARLDPLAPRCIIAPMRSPLMCALLVAVTVTAAAGQQRGQAPSQLPAPAAAAPGQSRETAGAAEEKISQT